MNYNMENLGIHWIPLKLSMLPYLIKEVDNVVDRFFGRIKSVE